jgi:predicted glycoside hydrolase/deacetylase ChbG (UPF0249 family)
MSPEISRGILRAHREGVVTSTSVLGNCDDLPGVRALLAEAPGLGVGVHLALIGGAPVAAPEAVPSLLGSDGKLRTRGQDFIAAWAQRKIDPADVERELNEQVARIRDAGISIDHLDTHRHLGFLPAVGTAVETVARRHDIAGIRSAVESPTLAWATSPRRGAIAGLLTGLAWMTRRQLGARRHGPQSWGFVESGRLDEVRILEVIGRLSPGPHELICHPGETDGGAADDGLGHYDRVGEIAALTSPKVRRALERRGVTLCRWGDLV